VSFCQQCGGEIPAGSKFCPKCGRPFDLTISPAQRKKRHQANPVGRAVGIILAVGLVFGLFALGRAGSSRSPAANSPNVGEQGRIASGAKTVIAAVDDASFDQVVKSQQAHDQTGLTVLILSGKAFFIDEGTRVLVIDRSTFRRKVRTLEGPAVGRAGWIPAEWVKR
jgi:zinc-ribbon domain